VSLNPAQVRFTQYNIMCEPIEVLTEIAISRERISLKEVLLEGIWFLYLIKN
jgi:hypothetical protein